MIHFKIFCVTLLFSLSTSEPTVGSTPCKKSDKACITAAAAAIIKNFDKGFPDKGIKSLDPMPIEEVVGDLSGLKYKFTDSTLEGMSKCDLENVDMDLDNSKLRFDLVCNNVKLYGHYNIKGQLIVLPVEGDGAYSLLVKTFRFAIDAELKRPKDNEGIEHIGIKKYQFKAVPTGGIVYDFKNLFNGRKDLAETVLKFANENWKEVADFVQDPVIVVVAKKVIANVNKYFKLVPLGDLISN